jgi:mRNA interferase RelE/StbE
MKTETYDLLIETAAHAERKALPGNIRQLMRRTIGDLAFEPRPHISEALDTSDLDIPVDVELRRIRLEHWRVIYAINDVEKWVWVWGVRRRPPYNYQDLAEFIARL